MESQVYELVGVKESALKWFKSILFVVFYFMYVCYQIIPNFHPPLSDKVRQGIYTSLRHIIEKRVLPSLYALFDHNRLDKDLRVMVRETFQEFCYPVPSLEGI